MNITTTTNGSEITMVIEGRLDTTAAPNLMKDMEEVLVEGITHFILDMGQCDYVASSGLRAILWAQKKMNSLSGTMVVKNVIGDVMEVFDMTGFSQILTIE